MPARKSHPKANSILNNPSFAHIPDDQMYYFKKDEIVWAKMKFFSAWPAQVCISILTLAIYWISNATFSAI